MVSFAQILLLAAAIGSLALSSYSVFQRNYQEAVGGLVIAVTALAVLLV
jgi:hypothetical protein